MLLYRCRLVGLPITVGSYKKLAISKHKTVNLHESLIEKLNFIKPLNRQFLIGAVISCPSVLPKCCQSSLQCLSALNGCGCLHSLLLLLRLPVR